MPLSCFVLFADGESKVIDPATDVQECVIVADVFYCDTSM